MLFIIEDNYRVGNIEFEYSPIGDEGMAGLQAKGDMRNIEWVNNILIVDAIISMDGACPNQELFAKYKINANTLSLFVSDEKFFIEEIFMDRAKCIGYYAVKFKIKNLEKKDYKVLLYKKRFMTRNLLVDEGVSLN